MTAASASSEPLAPEPIQSTRASWAFGIVTFAGVTLLTLAFFEILQAIAAIAEDEVFVAGVNYTYAIDLTEWGWIHLVLGLIGVAIGIGLLAGQAWARVAGIVVAVVVALANFAWLPYFPIWSLLIIAFSAVVIWALTAQLSED
jgi:hypothetical protein